MKELDQAFLEQVVKALVDKPEKVIDKKKVNALPKKTAPKKEVVAEEAPVVEVAPEVVAETPTLEETTPEVVEEVAEAPAEETQA